MASRRKEHQEDAKLRMLKIISSNPQITSRELAQKVGISNWLCLLSFNIAY